MDLIRKREIKRKCEGYPKYLHQISSKQALYNQLVSMQKGFWWWSNWKDSFQYEMCIQQLSQSEKNVHWITIQYFLLQTAVETDCLHVECHRGVSINTVRHCVCGHAKKCLNLWLLLFNTSQKDTKSFFWKNAQYLCHALLIWWPFLVIHITDAKTHVLHRFHEKKKHNKLGVPI